MSDNFYLKNLAQGAASASAPLALNTVTQVTAASDLTMTLPSPVAGALIVVEREAASTGTVAATGNIRGVGSSTVTLSLGSESEMFLGTATTWNPVAGHKTLGSLDGRYANVFSPMAFGAAGDGTTDDTAAVLAAAAAAIAAGGIFDVGYRTYKTISPIPVSSNFRMRGAGGLNAGKIINSASDLFTMTGSVSYVTIENCTLISGAGGGHIWNASAGPSMSLWSIQGVIAQQNNAAKAIWYQVGGAFIDCLIDRSCNFYGSAAATVSPWTMLQGAVTFNSIKFSRMRCNGNGATVPFFNFDGQSAAGWTEDVIFDHITFEVCTGGAIAMTASTDVTISMCAVWDIPAPRTDTAAGSTSSSTPNTVTDTAGAVSTADVGKAISGGTIPAGTYITAVAGSAITISGTGATATASGLTFIVGGASANLYSFSRSSGGYACTDIQVRGGKADTTATTGTGFYDFFADTHSQNIVLDSFGSWGTAALISSPAPQTTIINPVVTGSPSPVLTSPAFSAAGLSTGANAGARFIGGTASGAPASGTFAVGDFAIDRTGAVWVCTGSPGTWTQAGGATAPSVSFLTSTAIWTKPPGASAVDIILLGGGGGGGSGAIETTGNAGGGGGAAGGGVTMRTFVAADLTSTVSVTIGAGGTGASAVTGTAGASGSLGTSAGGNTTFGSYTLALGGGQGGGGSASGGAAGNAASLSTSLGGAGGAGGAAASGTGAGAANAASGGGGGGGASTGTAFNGGTASYSVLGGTANTATGGVAGGASPGTGTSPAVKGTPSCGAGGGAGANGASPTAQAGAAAFYGGGGGGGGGAFIASGTGTSGAGGNGGGGFALIISHFA